MTEPLVSVKMITYNHAPYIAQAIEGVLQQKTAFPFELVIGEDCSTDETRGIVFDYQKRHPDIIRVITSEKNVGMKTNGYRTTNACRGKYIAFCEGDDYWQRSDKMQIQVEYLESHPECGMVFADCDVYYNRSKKFIRGFNCRKGLCSFANLSIEQILWGEWIKWTCTVVTRGKLYVKVIESDPYLHQSETFLMGDTQAWAELASISKVTYIPECLGTYRVLDESASYSKDLRKLYKFAKSASEMKLYLAFKHKLSEDIRKKEELDWSNISLRLAFYEKNAKLASEIKEKRKTFTFKEWLRYFGAKYSIFHYGYLAGYSFINLFRRDKHDQWP